jgi:hypothetical protein
VLRFSCDGVNRGESRVFFDDVTTADTLNRDGREMSPNTVIGSIGFFACQHRKALVQGPRIELDMAAISVDIADGRSLVRGQL